MTSRSTCRVTEVLIVDESFPAVVSVSVTAVTATVLLIVSVPVAVDVTTVTTTVRVSETPEASVPTVHSGSRKVVVPLGVVESSVAPEGFPKGFYKGFQTFQVLHQ